MASISKTPSSKWKCRVRFKGASVSQTFTTRKAALAWGKRKERELESDRAFGYAESKLRKLTLAELCLGYLEQWDGRDRSRPARVQWWIDTLGAERVLEIDKRQIRDALALYARSPATRRSRDGRLVPLGRNHSAGSVNRLHAALSAVFEWGKHELDLPANPAREVKGQTEPKGRVRFLSRDEIARLLKACKESPWPKLHALVLMALATGARRGELMKLRWESVNFQERTVTLWNTKNEDHRVLTLTPEATAELERLHKSGLSGKVANLEERRLRDYMLVFCGRRPMVPHAFDADWHEALRKAGIKDFVFHDLRHVCAALLASAGRSLYEIGQVLGHKSAATTMRYAFLLTDAKRQMTDEVLDNLSGGNSDE